MNFVTGLKWSEKHIMCLLNHRYLRSLSNNITLFTISVLCHIIFYLRSLSNNITIHHKWENHFYEMKGDVYRDVTS